MKYWSDFSKAQLFLSIPMPLGIGHGMGLLKITMTKNSALCYVKNVSSIGLKRIPVERMLIPEMLLMMRILPFECAGMSSVTPTSSPLSYKPQFFPFGRTFRRTCWGDRSALSQSHVNTLCLNHFFKIRYPILWNMIGELLLKRLWDAQKALLMPYYAVLCFELSTAMTRLCAPFPSGLLNRSSKLNGIIPMIWFDHFWHRHERKEAHLIETPP